MQETTEAARRAAFATVQVGQVRRGVVSAIMGFGVFVDIGGVDAVIHAPNLSWSRWTAYTDVVQVGDEVVVLVLAIDEDRQRISVSLKHLLPDPLAAFARARLGTQMSGAVDRVLAPGVFVCLENGIVGLVPAAEAGPGQFRPGDAVTVSVEAVNLSRRQVRLSWSTPATAEG